MIHNYVNVTMAAKKNIH